MAARRKPPVKKVKFELTRSSIAGVGIVCFCIFLWMFLLGVWAGQSLLLPSPSAPKKIAQHEISSGQPPARPIVIEAETMKKIRQK